MKKRNKAFINSQKVGKVIMLITLIITILIVFTLGQFTNQETQKDEFQKFGSIGHVELKGLTEKQMKEIRKDSIIKKYGVKTNIIKLPRTSADQYPIELSYWDSNALEWSMSQVLDGSLPTENTHEVIADTETIEDLGIQKKIGEKFSLTLDDHGKTTSEEFVLCGWNKSYKKEKKDQLLLSKSFSTELLNQLEKKNNQRYDMEIMFSNTLFLERRVKKLLAAHDYQDKDRNKDNYVEVHINPGYQRKK